MVQKVAYSENNAIWGVPWWSQERWQQCFMCTLRMVFHLYSSSYIFLGSYRITEQFKYRCSIRHHELSLGLSNCINLLDLVTYCSFLHYPNFVSMDPWLRSSEELMLGCPILVPNCFKENSICFKLIDTLPWAVPNSDKLSLLSSASYSS